MSSECKRWIALSDRDAIGDELSVEESAFVRSHGAECRDCAAEADVFRKMESLVDDKPEADDEPLAPLPLRWRLRGRPMLAGALAVAAAAAAVVMVQGRPSAPVVAVTPAPPPVKSNVVLSLTSGGAVEVDGRVVAIGQTLPQGSVLFARAGSACLRIDGRIRSCVTQGSLVRVADTGPALRLELLGGKMASELDPLPAGTSFGVTTREGAAVAIGTAFSVEVPPGAAPVVTRVMHGTVLVQAARGAEHKVGAHEMNVMGQTPAALPATDEEREREIVLAAPREENGTVVRIEGEGAVRVDDRVVGVGPVELMVAPGQHVVEVGAREKTTRETVEVRGEPVRYRAPEAAPTSASASANASTKGAAADLLAAARERTARGEVDGAARVYRELMAKYAGSVEAHAALVPYGEMQLTRLHDARGALESFERYSKTAGPLEEEASYGRIRALRALGREAAERVAVEDFVRKFPDGPLAASLRRGAEGP
jgi:hypothetical protein